MSKKFVIIGVAGYIAPRHIEAIKSTGNQLVAAYDPSDSVGVLDRYFPDCKFYTDFNQLKVFVKKNPVDYVSVCSPNHLHKIHIEFGLENSAHVICEKPLVLYEKDLDELEVLEKKYNRRVYSVLQLRFHDAIKKLKDQVSLQTDKHYKVALTYLTSRGNWYHASWKGDDSKSGGLSTNIGVHLFDMLTWVFGSLLEIEIKEKNQSTVKGFLKLERADVNWTLSIDRKLLPADIVSAGKTTFRSIQIDGEEFEFSEGFTELHQTVYKQALSGDGFGISETRAAIKVVEAIRKL